MMKDLVFILLLLCLLSPIGHRVAAQCNGDPNLCNRRFDEVTYLTTHNAFNYQGAFLFPNQSYSVSRQLQDGVRGLMLDVYWHNGRPAVYHGSSFLGTQPLSDILNEIRGFLDQNPNEVVTIIFECYISSAQMEAVFNLAGLIPYTHSQPPSQPWPTLGDMIANNRRLVVFSDVNDGQSLPWYHYVWDYCVETHYSAGSRADFSCNYNRGDSSKSLFILNHFVTHPTLGYGLADSALAVNSNPYFTSRAMGCWAYTGKIPNFLTVDFYEKGNAMATKDNLNAGFVGSADESRGSVVLSRVVPNPNRGSFRVDFGGMMRAPVMVRLTDLHGRVIFTSVFPASRSVQLQLDVPIVMPGIYWLEYRSGEQRGVEKIVVIE